MTSEDELGSPPSRADVPRFLKVLTIAAVLFTFGNALWAAWDQGVTYDEFYHLAWPRRLLLERVDERGSALRLDSKTPALLPAVVTASALEAQGVESERTLRFATRLTPVAYLVLSLVLVAFLGRSLNPPSSWLAVLLVALDPNMAANASIATTDVAYACATLLFALALIRLRDSPHCEWLVGAALGLAFAAKYTAVLLVPVAIAHACFRRRAGVLEVGRRLAVLTLAACLTASCLYLFVGVGAPLGSLQFGSPLLRRAAATFPGLPVPFPRAILTGIDKSMEHNDDLGWNCYLFGEIHPRGVWYYFVAHWLMKTPVALLAAIAVGLWSVRRGWSHASIAIIGGLFALHLFYFSFLFSTQIGIRYALMCIPLASILAAWGLSGRVSRGAWWVVPLAVLALAERVPYWGDPIAFTNPVVWPKSRAYWYTADSNLDYGQNRERVERYIKESQLAVVADQATVTPGLYVVSANNLTKVGNFRSHRWLIDHDIPAIRFGFTDFGFSITGERFEAFMNETRVAPSLPTFDQLCSGPLGHYPPGSQLPFVRDDHPDDGRLWVVCARSKKGVDLGLTVRSGRLLFGRVVSDSTCSVDLLQSKQAAWFRVERGGSAALCIREIPFRRTTLPYLVDAFLTVRGQGADVEIRQISVARLETP